MPACCRQVPHLISRTTLSSKLPSHISSVPHSYAGCVSDKHSRPRAGRLWIWFIPLGSTPSWHSVGWSGLPGFVDAAFVWSQDKVNSEPWFMNRNCAVGLCTFITCGAISMFYVVMRRNHRRRKRPSFTSIFTGLLCSCLICSCVGIDWLNKKSHWLMLDYTTTMENTTITRLDCSARFIWSVFQCIEKRQNICRQLQCNYHIKSNLNWSRQVNLKPDWS